MLLHMISHFGFEFRAAPHLLENVLGIALGEPAAGSWITGGEGAGPVGIHVEQSVF